MNIIFDAGGVLFYIAEFRDNIIRRILNSSGYSSMDIDECMVLLKLFDEDYCEAHLISDWNDEKHWLQARADYIISIVDAGNDTLKDKVYILAFDSFQYHLYDETIGCLEELMSGYNLYVLSNATATLDWAFDYLDIRRFFKDIVISSYVGYEKPDRRIYEHILSVIDQPADSCVFIDDRIENVDVARRCGINSFHLDRKTGMTLYDFEAFIRNLDNVEA